MAENLSFVIPCYRSEHTIRDVVTELTNKTRELQIGKYEIILVNDCSPDDTWRVIRELCEKDDHIVGISLARNFGQHAALLAGYSFVKGEIIVSLDDDGQAPVDELNLLLDKLEEGYDAVYAYYKEIKQNGFRKFGTWMAGKMGQIMIGFPKDYKGSSFFAARRFIIDEVIKYRNPYPYLGGLVYQTTHNVACVMTHQRKRAYGRSGYSFSRLLELWLNGFTAFSVKPLRLGAVFGMALSMLGFLTALILIIKKLFSPDIAVGWTSIIAAILIVGGLILLMLGLVGEYIGRVYISINNSPQYVVRETINTERKQESIGG